MWTLAFLLASVAPARAAEFESALIIILDDIGTDKMGAYADDVENPDEDRPETPTLDLVAGAGVRFSDAWATPLCSPTRAMVLSGNYPYRTGVGHALDRSAERRLGTLTDTLAQLASDNGLHTAMIGKSHLGTGRYTLTDEGTADGPEYPIRLGFDYFAGSMFGGIEAYDGWLRTVSQPRYRGSTRYTNVATYVTDSATDVTTQDALDWMNRAPYDRKLTVVSYNLAHDTEPLDGGGRWDNGARVCGAEPGSDTANMKVMVECLDDALYDLLSDVPDLSDTLVVVLGDNGTDYRVAEGNFDEGRGKTTAYESGVRVPFIVADGAALKLALRSGGVLPRSARFQLDTGTVVSDPSSVVDVFATVADLLDLSSSTCTVGDTCAKDSLSLRSVLTGGAPIRSDVWTETWKNTSSGTTGYAAVRQGDLKLLMQVTTGSTCYAFAAFDLAADRWETTNVASFGAYSSDVASLRALVETHRSKMNFEWLPETSCSGS